jgi:hypothetical protein
LGLGLHKSLTARIIATKHTSHKVTGPDAPLKFMSPTSNDRSPPVADPRRSTIQAEEIADNGTAMVAAK